jgi:hypothetical protein
MMRGWAFNFNLGDKSHRCWNIGLLGGGDYRCWTLGCKDWADPLRREWDRPNPLITNQRIEFNNIEGDITVDLLWLKTVDDEGYEQWPLKPGWKFQFSNPFIGWPSFTYLNKIYQLKEFQGFHFRYIDLPVYTGENQPADFYVYRQEDSSDFKEIYIRID